MSEQDQEKQPPVTVEDVVEILAKSATTSDPDEREKLDRFNQQVREEREGKPEEESDKDQKGSPESPQQGSQPTGTQRGRKP